MVFLEKLILLLIVTVDHKVSNDETQILMLILLFPCEVHLMPLIRNDDHTFLFSVGSSW